MSTPTTPTTRTFKLSYDGAEIACVEIAETEQAEQVIREMVEFWSGWEHRLRQSGGDYTDCWLRQLTRFLLRNDRAPCYTGEEDEGWYPLDGTYGITLKSRLSCDLLDSDLIGVSEL